MKNKRNFIKTYGVGLTIGILVAVLIIFIVCNRHDDVDYKPRACGGDRCFIVELVKTPADQQKGLMYREYMEEGDGMLFVFDYSDIYNFWMKNTLIPLDIIRIDENFKVVKILTAQPCITEPCPTYQPGILATYVLEINAGMAAKHGITEGTRMKLINIQ